MSVSPLLKAALAAAAIAFGPLAISLPWAAGLVVLLGVYALWLLVWHSEFSLGRAAERLRRLSVLRLCVRVGILAGFYLLAYATNLYVAFAIVVSLVMWLGWQAAGRPPLRFSLRTVVFGVTVLCIAFAFLGRDLALEWLEDRRVSRAVQTLVAGNFVVRQMSDEHGGVTLFLDGPGLTVEMARALNAAERVNSLQLRSSPSREASEELAKCFGSDSDASWWTRRDVEAARE